MVGSDGSRQLHERGDATAACPRQPPVEMPRSILRPAEPVEVAQAFLELPAAVENRPFATERVEHLELRDVEVIRVLEQGPTGVLDPSGLVGRRR